MAHTQTQHSPQQGELDKIFVKIIIVPGRRLMRVFPPQWGLLADSVLNVAIKTGNAGPGAVGGIGRNLWTVMSLDSL